MPTVHDIDVLAQGLAHCHRASNPLDAFNDVVLGRVDPTERMHDGSFLGQYWKAQRAICGALWDESVTTVAVPACHSSGKSWCAAGVILGWMTLLPNSLVVSTSPSNDQLTLVLWKEVRRAFHGSPLATFGRITSNPQKLDLGDGIIALGFSTNKPERAQGHHTRGPVLVIADEASGIEDPDTWATLASLKPKKRLLISNPLRPDGPFYDVCRRAERDPSVRLIHISAFDTPDIHQEHSERGLADKSWLREMEGEYGRDSLVWKVRVRAEFPSDAFDVVVPTPWVELAARTVHQPAGKRRIAIDLGKGNGGDPSVVMTRDDNGVLACEASNQWSFEVTARKAAGQALEYGVEPYDISFDVEGIGSDFDHRLRAEGIKGAQPYRGGAKGGELFFNLRAAAAWACRRRLDPRAKASTRSGLMVTRTPFSLSRMPAEFLRLLTEEFRDLRYEVGPGGVTKLENAELYEKRLKHSPDFQATFCQSFAFDDSPLASDPSPASSPLWPWL